MRQPNNGVALLEIGNLGGPEGSPSYPLDTMLRGTYTQGPALRAIVDRVSDAIEKGLRPGQ